MAECRERDEDCLGGECAPAAVEDSPEVEGAVVELSGKVSGIAVAEDEIALSFLEDLDPSVRSRLMRCLDREEPNDPPFRVAESSVAPFVLLSACSTEMMRSMNVSGAVKSASDFAAL